MQVLIIDDDPLHLSSLETSLTVRGYECLSFLDPVSAIAAYNERCNYVVITTVKILEISGEEVLESILTVNPEAKVILITDFDDAVNKSTVRKGIYAYFRKPIMMENLIITLQKIENTYNSVNKKSRSPEKRISGHKINRTT